MAYGTINADQIGTSVANTSLGAGNASIMKNRIINGAMVIDQRNAGASSTAQNSYTVDRWKYVAAQASKGTWGQNLNAITPPAGFTNYLGFQSSSAYSVASGDYFALQQVVEGYNIADLGWGTANAKAITISAWVYSSLTGTFGGALQISGLGQCYPFSYTISSANTWTYVTVNIAGDTAGSWNTTNGAGIYVAFSLGAGSSWTATGGAWTVSNAFQATGATSVVGTNGATFYITGVQLEVGSSATGFEYRLYNQELSACQRYYQFVGGDSVYQFVGTGMNYATTSSSIQIPILVRFRAIPSIGVSSASNWAITYASGAQAVATSIADDQSGTATVNVGVTVTGTPLTNGGAAKLIATNTLNARLTMSAEL
jgi:hypothetical protein